MAKKLISFDDAASSGTGLPDAVETVLHNTYVRPTDSVITGKIDEDEADLRYAPASLANKILISSVDPGAVPDGTIWVQPTITESVLDTLSGLSARWKPDALTAGNGSEVTSFAPTVGAWTSPLVASSGVAPTLAHSALNGRKVLSFNGTNQYMDLDHEDITGPSTIFIVCDLQTAGSAGGRAVASMTSGSFRSIRLSSNGTTGGMLSSGSAPNSIYDSWTSTSGWRIIAAVFDGASSALYRHKRTPITGTTNIVNQADLRLGRGPAASSEYSRIDIADLAIVNRACTDTEVKDVLEELADLYGQTLGA
ncbi:LamG-like jellyroll fold domain-containing protein [Rhodococcus artemisiae]|uniref:Concanavalin A-like lectin/glucanase superfamily protein n=1 Tax=Rhodococcus artemisiae TaxID=714159 RepID=A0ABU7LBS0_9NOCA|nr:hypothetical protein [Rhodococcus artemisiae]MEE2058989.1 hypothetical protein [Rhodococcus artemisiae]